MEDRANCLRTVSRERGSEMGIRLVAMQLLTGQTEEITMMQLRKGPGDIIDQVQMGKTFTITKARKVVAVISQPELTALELGAEIRRLRLG